MLMYTLMYVHVFTLMCALECIHTHTHNAREHERRTLAHTCSEDSHELHVDPRQAWLKKKHLEVKIKRDALLQASRAFFVENLRLR